MIEEKEIKWLANRHIGVSFITVIVAIAVLMFCVWLTHTPKFSEYLLASLIAVTFGLVETLVSMKIWTRIVVDHPDSLPTFYTASSGFRMLAALTVLFVVFLFVGRDAMLPYFIVFVVAYFVLLTLHSFFFKKMTEKLL